MKTFSKTRIIVSAVLVLLLACSIVGAILLSQPSTSFAESTQEIAYVCNYNTSNVYDFDLDSESISGTLLFNSDVNNPSFEGTVNVQMYPYAFDSGDSNLTIWFWYDGISSVNITDVSIGYIFYEEGRCLFDVSYGCAFYSFEEDGVYSFSIPLSELPVLNDNKTVTVNYAVVLCDWRETERPDGHCVIEDTGSFCTLTKVVAEKKPLPVTPSKTGYTFTGWYTNEACTELYTKDYITDNITLYAGFQANTYTINFDGGKSVYSNVTGSTASLSMTYDQSKALPECGFTNAGYKFVGWSTDKNATTATYNAGQSVNNLSSTDGDTITLYAIWTESQYTIKFNANGGSGSMSDQIVLRDISTPLKANGFTRTGYTFVGWATSTTGSVVYSNEQSVLNIATLDSPITLYAVWNANTYTVNFDANGGNGSMSSQSMTYGVASNLSNCQFTRTGYVFKGWSTTKDGSVVYKNLQSVSNLSSANGSSITLYAVWEPIQCVVTFIVDGEVYAVVSVDWGTPAEDVIGQAVSSALYKVEDEKSLPN